MPEKAVCSECGKNVEITVSMTASGHEPTPPLCMKCWDTRVANVVGEIKSMNRRKKAR